MHTSALVEPKLSETTAVESDEPSLEQMLAAFDPQRHAGEEMAFAPRGVEAFTKPGP